MDAKIAQRFSLEYSPSPPWVNTLFRFTVGVRLQVQIVGMLCGTPGKDAYQEIV